MDLEEEEDVELNSSISIDHDFSSFKENQEYESYVKKLVEEKSDLQTWFECCFNQFEKKFESFLGFYQIYKDQNDITFNDYIRYIQNCGEKLDITEEEFEKATKSYFLNVIFSVYQSYLDVFEFVDDDVEFTLPPMFMEIPKKNGEKRKCNEKNYFEQIEVPYWSDRKQFMAYFITINIGATSKHRCLCKLLIVQAADDQVYFVEGEAPEKKKFGKQNSLSENKLKRIGFKVYFIHLNKEVAGYFA